MPKFFLGLERILNWSANDLQYLDLAVPKCGRLVYF